MSKDETAGLNQAGSNISKLKKDVKAGVDRIEALKVDRTSINESIASVKADLATKGIPKKALDMALSYMNMDPDKREGFDVAYEIVREAIELPMETAQMDMNLGDDKKDGDK